MRTIKFRAKDYKGSFQFGTYYYGCMYPTSFNGHYVNDTQIDEKTLGQFTGLHDKNGKEIYEGDIVKYHTQVRATHVVATVKFEQQACAYWAKWSEKADGRTINRYKELTATFGDGETFNCDTYEIIGNIYEHPNLLT
jgi:uncharacterized phage protein (TIGR01671 family)